MIDEVRDIATCKCGNEITKVFKSGKRGKYCGTCMARQAGRAKSSWRRGPIACACCRIRFTPDYAHQRFCSSKCKYRDRDRRESVTGLSRADYQYARAKKSIEQLSFTCAQCGCVAQRRLSAKNAAAGYTNKFCSLACRDAARSAASHQAQLGRGLHSNCFALYCGECSSPFVSRHERAFCGVACAARKRGRDLHARAARSIHCEDCGVEFCPVYGRSHASLCVPCAHGRARAHRLAAKIVRRTRIRSGRVERVDPLVVFDRDGWTCQLCGAATPREKRGTYDLDAPELDHIIALALGGEHSYRNTQCACRRCNGLKADRPLEALASLSLPGSTSQ